MITLSKTDPTCSNIYLIDENTCLGKSLDIIQSNIQTLSSNLSALMINVDDWFDVYTSIYSLSAQMLSTIFNVKNIEKEYNSTYSTISGLSSSWLKEFSLVYPKIFDFNEWYNYDADVRDGILNTWLQNNFPVENYLDNQVINVFVNLNQSMQFLFYYTRSYSETCAVTYSSGGTAKCTPCSDNRAYQGCNITGKGCRNAWSYCGSTTSNNQVQGICKTSGGKDLTITSSKLCTDRYFSRTVFYGYIKDAPSQQWVKTWT